MLCVRKPFTSATRSSSHRTVPAAPRPAVRSSTVQQHALISSRAARLAVRSIPVSGPGSSPTAAESPAEEGVVSAVLMESMRQKIGEALETDQVTVTDAYGDGRHVSIDVVSKLFDGKGAVARQRMVYKAIWLELSGAVHAVDAMTTKTPEEAA